MVRRCVVLLVLLLCSAPGAYSQHLVQAAVDGLASPEMAFSANTLVQQQPGVLMARFDVNTRNMMLHVIPECGLDKSALNVLLAPMGLELRCYSRNPVGATPFRHVDAGTCSDDLEEE